MNSFCQCAPSLRLLEWMGSCIQGPSSCNEQDGVQSLFHHRFFSHWERQLLSIGWVRARLKGIRLICPGRKNAHNDFCIETFTMRWHSLWAQCYVCTLNTGQHGGAGVLNNLDYEPGYMATMINVYAYRKLSFEWYDLSDVLSDLKHA